MSGDTNLSALLDFYSDKASAHASFLVAISIGLFTLPQLKNHVDMFWLSILFIFLWAIGLWTLLNFSYFSEHAVWTKNFLVKPEFTINPNRPYDNQIFDKVRVNWEITPLRLVYLKLKAWRRTDLTKLKSNLGKTKAELGFTRFFPSFYSLLGLLLSSLLFPREVIMFWVVVFFVVFFSDVFFVILACARDYS